MSIKRPDQFSFEPDRSRLRQPVAREIILHRLESWVAHPLVGGYIAESTWTWPEEVVPRAWGSLAGTVPN